MDIGIKGPARGFIHSRPQGTKVELAGRTAFLPNAEVPLVVQKLTTAQIEAIPRERFAVSLIEKPSPLAMAKSGSGRKGRGLFSGVKMERAKLPAFLFKGDDVISYVQKTSGTITDKPSGTKEYITITALLSQVKQHVDDLYDYNLELSRNKRETSPDDDNLFYPPVDEGCMTKCIKKAIAHFFGNKETCKIAGKEYKLAAFCLLMHDYFIRMHILKNTTRTPFCNYLLKHVMKDCNTTFTSRTFTNYAKEYKNVEEVFTGQDKLKINFNVHPEPSGKPLQDAFHEIGHFFHTSEYFKHLRDMRDNLAKFHI